MWGHPFPPPGEGAAGGGLSVTPSKGAGLCTRRGPGARRAGPGRRACASVCPRRGRAVAHTEATPSRPPLTWCHRLLMLLKTLTWDVVLVWVFVSL